MNSTPVTWVYSHRRTLYAWWNLHPAAPMLTLRPASSRGIVSSSRRYTPSCHGSPVQQPSACHRSLLRSLLVTALVKTRWNLGEDWFLLQLPPLFIPSSSSQVVLIFSLTTHNLKPHFLTTTGRALRFSKNKGLCSHLFVNVIQDIYLRCVIRPSFIPFVSVSRLPGAILPILPYFLPLLLLTQYSHTRDVYQHRRFPHPFS